MYTLGAVGSRLCSARGAVVDFLPEPGFEPTTLGYLGSGFKPNALSIRPMTARSLHLTHPKRIRTWSSGQPLYSARGAVRGSVPCSRALQSQFLPARDVNLQTSGYRPDSLTIRPRLPLFSAFNPSEAHTHLEQWAAIVRRPGSS